MFGPPKQHSFYEAFERQAAIAIEAAQLLSRMFENFESGGSAVELSKQIREAEQRGDEITHHTIAELHKTWITPIDRADIHGLASALDDVLDLIEAASDCVVLFEIKKVAADACALAQVLVRTTEAVHKAVQLLPTMRRSNDILKLCVEINRLENEADRIYRHALAGLFHSGDRTDPAIESSLDVLKWRDIFDNLEGASDRCEDVANILEGIVLEYA